MEPDDATFARINKAAAAITDAISNTLWESFTGLMKQYELNEQETHAALIRAAIHLLAVTVAPTRMAEPSTCSDDDVKSHIAGIAERLGPLILAELGKR